MKTIIKVDIATGRVLVDNLAEFWSRLAMGEGRPEPVPRENPALFLKPEEETDVLLLERIRAFNQRRRTSVFWSDRELYRLARLLLVENQTISQAAYKLARRPKACRYVYGAMRREGVI